MNAADTYAALQAEIEHLRWQLDEVTETLQAIRTGQVDALVVEGETGHQLYTLKTADQTYRVFIETMNEGAVTLNAGGLIVYGNSMFAAMIGMPLSQVIGLSFDQFVAAPYREQYRQLLTGGWTKKSKVETSLTGKTGEEIPCLLSVTMLELDEGTSLSMIVTDLTEQKATQLLLKENNERLLAANAALEVSNNALNMMNSNLQQFTYVASHDLQEPLRKIQQFGSLLKLNYHNTLGEQGADWVTRMESAAIRMSGLIRDLLAYSRLTMPTDTFVDQSLNDIVAEVLILLEMQVQETGAIIDVGDLGTVPGEGPQLAQVFQNLLSNALKFSRPDVPPHIQITRRNIRRTDLPRQYQFLSEHQHFCAIRVTDNGIGFDAHQAERIFGTFQRLHGRNQYPGTGIGLAIVKRVVENHRGYVMATSQPGEGAEFTVYLPTNEGNSY